MIGFDILLSRIEKMPEYNVQWAKNWCISMLFQTTQFSLLQIMSYCLVPQATSHPPQSEAGASGEATSHPPQSEAGGATSHPPQSGT